MVGFAEDWSTSILPSQFAGKGYSIQENYTIANDIAAELEASGKCNATFLLIHAPANEAAEQLGENTAFDLVLGGHNHYTIAGHTNWGLPYLQGGKRGEAYAYAELKFKVDTLGNISFSNVRGMQTYTVDTQPHFILYSE